MKFTTSNGLTLHYDYRQAAPGARVVVLINSLGTDLRIWDEVVDLIGHEVSLLRYDKRGHGLSDMGATPHSIEDHASDLLSLIKTVVGRPVTLFGLSIGGLVAQTAYSMDEKQVEGLVLCGTSHRIGTFEMWQDRIDKITAGGIEAVADHIISRWFTPAFAAANPQVIAACFNMLTRQSRAGYIASSTALQSADNDEMVRKIKLPTLCMVGDHDGSTPPAVVKAMADRIENASFEILADAGHIPCIEIPAVIAGKIRQYTAGLTQR